jgi:hypothetical protein
MGNLLNSFGVPEEIQKEFDPAIDNIFFQSTWNNGKPESFKKSLNKFGENLFWEKIKNALKTNDPELTLRQFQDECNDTDLTFAVSLIKRSVSLLKNIIKNKTMNVVDHM